jgi:hypothetical protein
MIYCSVECDLLANMSWSEVYFVSKRRLSYFYKIKMMAIETFCNVIELVYTKLTNKLDSCPVES